MFYIIMGPAGCGKTTFGRRLAAHLNMRFFDADDFHPAKNIEKMRQGIPLTDDDRWPWLERMADELPAKGVLACSALKQSYRLVLSKYREVQFIYLKVPVEELERRIRDRQHFFPAELLQTQLAILEEPHNALILDGTLDPDVLVTLPQSF